MANKDGTNPIAKNQQEKLDMKKKPPTNIIQSVQFDLFRQFVTNDRSEVSNSIEIWENIPKYFLTPKMVDGLRTETGHADPYKFDYKYQNEGLTVRIQPALIEQEDGKYRLRTH